jgi:FKBP-type peptidyl-prolyl cis-trans isomerase SlyD
LAIQQDQIVSILYEAKDTTTKEIIDSNMNGQPLVFMFGRQQIIPGLEAGLANMNMGDSQDLIVQSKDAYGEYHQDAVQVLPKEQFAGIELEKGMSLYGQDEQGGTIEVRVKDFDDKTVTVDFNHPLAGKDLMFSVHVTMVRNPTPEESASGIPMENQQMAGGCSTGSCGCDTGLDDDLTGGSCGTGHGHDGSCGCH